MVESIILRGEFSNIIYSCIHMDKVVYQTAHPIDDSIQYNDLEKVPNDVISKFKVDRKMLFVEYSEIDGVIETRNSYSLINSYYVLLEISKYGFCNDSGESHYCKQSCPPILYRLD